MSDAYVHGYSGAEAVRLGRQAAILAEFIHGSVAFTAGARVLEAGCGIGAQTVQLAERHPHANIVAIDRSQISIRTAADRVGPRRNVTFHVADIYALPFEDAHFDSAFVCFLLEHLVARETALKELLRVLKPGATLYVFEGDHGSVMAAPHDPAIARLVCAASQLQISGGGDPYIGRSLCPVLLNAGFTNVSIEPCMAYADAMRPSWIEGFTRATFSNMMAGQREAVLASGLLSEERWREGMDALERTTQRDGTFCYTFFRATANAPATYS